MALALACDSAVGLTGFLTGAAGGVAAVGGGVRAGPVCELRPCNGKQAMAKRATAKKSKNDFNIGSLLGRCQRSGIFLVHRNSARNYRPKRGKWRVIWHTPETRLVHASATCACAGLVLAEEEGEEDENDGGVGELHVDILVTLRGGLSNQLVVHLSQS